MDKLKGQHPPGILQDRNIEKPQNITEQSYTQDFDVPQLSYELGGEEVGENLRDVVYHGGQAEEGRAPAEVLWN